MRHFIAAALLLITNALCAQILNPVKWTFSSENLPNGEVELIFRAKIDKGWHLYTTQLPPDGPIPTTFTFIPGPGYKLSGKVIEKGYITEKDPIFDMTLTYFENQGVYRQRVKLTKPGKQKITGEVEFMVCDKERCLPPDIVDFSFEVGASDSSATAADTPAADSTSNPIAWNFSSNHKGNNLYEIVAEASLAKGWHLYAQDLGKEAESAGPVPTIFTWQTGKEFRLSGKTTEPAPLSTYDPNFMLTLKYHENKVVFRQLVEATGTSRHFGGKVEFMVCTHEKCLPNDEISFLIDLNTGLPVQEKDTAAPGKRLNLKISTIDKDNPLSTCGVVEVKKEKSFMGIFLLGFLGGLIALLTPCVFPMIPLTVSFFTKSAGSRRKGIVNANLYGFFIFAIYLLLSLPFHLLGSVDPEIFNNISTNIYLNLTFFVVFVVFAISFFGYFEITLPASLQNKANSASDLGGILGIFFMALTLALVSFSCTGPILGSLLAGSLSSSGGAMQLTAGMGGFGLALALPFTLFALFPGMLKSLPKSGGWLNSVKVVLGFVELALAIKFLSNADLVDHWGIVTIEVFLISWIIITTGLAFYLLGKIRFPHDSPIKKLSPARIGLAVLSFIFVAYLVSGFFYDDRNKGFRTLGLLSGLAPPSGYSWIYPNHCPLNLSCFHSYEEGLAYARQVNKPILLDFTGWACVSCRDMEQNVWSKPEIFKMLNEDFVLISLYVDDREKLPADEQFVYLTSDGRKKKVRTVGDKWATFEVENFQQSAQPYYALISPDEVLLNTPTDYTPNVDEYRQFLECGLQTFKNKNLKAQK